MSRKYALIAPCRNEALFARRTLESILAQTAPPALVIVVDDGSTDETPQILAEYEAKYDFFRVVRRKNRGERAVGAGVIDAFYSGYDTLDPGEFDYVCKVDLDLDLPPRYFEILMDRMEENPRLGTVSGKPYYLDAAGRKVSERCGDEMSVGMTKFYRVSCFQQIGGFVRQVMWDGIDSHRCRMFGWQTASLDEPEIEFNHLRPMGSSQQSIWTGRLRSGFGQYFMGTGPLYMLAIAANRVLWPPVLIGALGMLVGYVQSAFKRVPRYDEPGFRRFLRAYQWQCLIRGKVRATKDLDEKQASRWQPGPAVASTSP